MCVILLHYILVYVCKTTIKVTVCHTTVLVYSCQATALPDNVNCDLVATVMTRRERAQSCYALRY